VFQLRRLRAALAGSARKGLASGVGLVVINALLLVWSRNAETGTTVGFTLAGVSAAAGISLLVALTEEIALRGLLLTRLRQVMADGIAVAVTAMIFAAFHVGRADLTALTIVELLCDGLLLGWMTIVTGDIWAAVGFHFGKNLAVALTLGGSHGLLAPPLLRSTPGQGAMSPTIVDALTYVLAASIVIGWLWIEHRRSCR
jgi:membrane protease YdiL (CAAX protease family)